MAMLQRIRWADTASDRQLAMSFIGSRDCKWKHKRRSQDVLAYPPRHLGPLYVPLTLNDFSVLFWDLTRTETVDEVPCHYLHVSIPVIE